MSSAEDEVPELRRQSQPQAQGLAEQTEVVRCADQRIEEYTERAEQDRQETQATNLVEFLEACHGLQAHCLVTREPSHSIKDDPSNAEGKVRPERIRLWRDFPQEQGLVWASIMSSTFADQRSFTSLAGFHQLGNYMSERVLSFEADLDLYESRAVEEQVEHIIDRMILHRDLRSRFRMGGTVRFANHANMLGENDPLQKSRLIRPDERTRRSEAVEPLNEDEVEIEAATCDSTTGNSRADKFCVLHIGATPKESISQLAAYIIEYKAAHKMTLNLIHQGLGDVELEEIINCRQGETAEVQSRRVVSAAITQAFSYMIQGGLEYGYVCTGQAFIFLRIPEDPTTVYYYLSIPALDVDKAKELVPHLRPRGHNAGHFTAVGQVLAFTLMSLRVRRRDADWRRRATEQLPIWETSFEEILDAIPPAGQTPSINDPSPAVHRSIRTSPIHLRRRMVPGRSAGRGPSVPSSDLSPQNDDSGPDGRHSGQRPSTSTNVSSGPSEPMPSSADESLGQDTEHAGQERPYCTHQCLLGLQTGGYLDADCPNVLAHTNGDNDVSPSALTSMSHSIDGDMFLYLLQNQLATDLSSDFTDLGICGARGALFQVRLSSLGYTMIAKCSPSRLFRYLRHENHIYERLRPIQGVHVPVCLGGFTLVRSIPYISSPNLGHVLLLSFAGGPMRNMISNESRATLSERAVHALHQVHQLGVLQRDAAIRNVVCHHETRHVLLVDFERAQIVQPSRTPLSEVSPNPIKERTENLEISNPIGPFAIESAALIRDFQAARPLPANWAQGAGIDDDVEPPDNVALSKDDGIAPL